MRNDPGTRPENTEKVTRAKVREVRLKSALKANLARRKAQGRARTSGEEASTAGRDNDKD